MTYYVTIGGRSFHVVVDGEDVVVDGHRCRAELVALPGTPARCLFLDGKPTSVALAEVQRDRWTLVYRGELVEVQVEDERTRRLRSALGTGAERWRGGVVSAPMPGLVTRVLIEPGQVVTAGQGLVVLEAMKMENQLKAPADGVVEEVRVAAGQAVEKGTPLVVIGGRGSP
jgi:pyruvate carboxylase subunit B